MNTIKTLKKQVPLGNKLPRLRVGVDKLSPRQLAFIHYYMLDGDASNAVKLARYECKHPAEQASRLLSHPLVKKMIERKRNMAQSKGLITYEDKIRILSDIAHDENKETSVRAVAELNRMQGHHAPTKTINLNLELTCESFEQLGIKLEDY